MDIALALLVARLVFGLAFAAHGTQKLFGWFGGYGLAGTGGFFESIGFRPGRLFAGGAAVSELVAGILIVLGLGGPIASVLVIATMLVAAVAVHAANGFFAATNGIELPLLYMVFGFIFAFTGFGPYSLDAAFGIAGIWTPALAWAAVALGILGGLANLAIRRKPSASPAT